MSHRKSWFRTLFGIDEHENYEEARSCFSVHGSQLSCARTNKLFGIGTFEHAALHALRQGDVPAACPGAVTKLSVDVIYGDVSALHVDPENRFATFQVASGFNCLEFMDPNGCPEDGVTGYQFDRTQGPACAISCGPGAVFRNYFAPVQQPDGTLQIGQTSSHMLDGLSGLVAALNLSQDAEFQCKAGYTMTTDSGLRQLNAALEQLQPAAAERLVKVGVHEDLQVTASKSGQVLCEDLQQTVNQVYTAGCSINYNGVRDLALWQPIATIVLRAAFEGTLWVGLRSAQRHWGRAGSRRVYLTLLGGGVFGNPLEWICDAMQQALMKFQGSGLEVFVVVYQPPVPNQLKEMLEQFDARALPVQS